MRLLVALITVSFAVMASSCGPEKTQEEKDAEACKSSFSAYYMATMFIKDRLKAPKTAEFSSHRESSVVFLGNCRHEVSGYVDSQNGFGALIRTSFVATVRSTGNDKWVLENIRLGK